MEENVKAQFIPGTNIEMLKEPVFIKSGITMPYTYSVGDFGSKFFTELRDNARIFGVRCPTCNRVLIPPRSTCGWCFSKLDEWVELSDKGTLVTYTIVHYPSAVHPVKPPIVYGIIQLDGADTGLAHLIGEVAPESLKIGVRVRAVFKEKREGNILDIDYFKPL